MFSDNLLYLKTLKAYRRNKLPKQLVFPANRIPNGNKEILFPILINAISWQSFMALLLTH